MRTDRAPLMLVLNVGLLAALTLTVAGCSINIGVGSQPRATPTSRPQPTTSPGCGPIETPSNPISWENQCQGTDEWRANQPLGDSHAIEGFVVPATVNVGSSVLLYVSTISATYTFRVYRLGWYQGHGARLMYVSPVYPGIAQSAPLISADTRMVSATNWTDPVSFNVLPSWTSGIYIVKMTSADGFVRYTPLVVRDDKAKAPILVVSSLFTYQAYNSWGGHSLYAGLDAQGKISSAARSYEVSFDRPYSDNGGLMDLALYEYNFVRWFEHEGFYGSYAADTDIHVNNQEALNHKLVIFAGHDEYWSTAMHDNVVIARDIGVSLAFMTANNSYWHVRVEDSPFGAARQVVCYREDVLDPFSAINRREVTVRFRDDPLNAPERDVIGQQYHGIASATAALVLADGASPYLADTTLTPGTALPGLVGGEYDQIDPGDARPDNAEILARSTVRCQKSPLCPANGQDVATAILYTGPKNAKIFSAGTFFWVDGLDDDQMIALAPPHAVSNAHFQKLTENLIRFLIIKKL
jgi:N,N-dimethylformamidase beta subunit-like protein